MQIHKSRLLWRTRGLHWDYLFLCVPTSLAASSWYDKFSAVFREVKTHNTPLYFKGTLGWRHPERGKVQSRFIACAAQDPIRKDWTQRPIQHYFIYFLDPQEPLSPAAWFAPLLSGLARPYDELFEAEREDAEALSHAEVLRRFARLGLSVATIEVAQDGDKVSYTSLGELNIEEKKKSRPIFRSWRELLPEPAAWLAPLLGLLGACLVIGLVLKSCFDEEPPISAASDLSACQPDDLARPIVQQQPVLAVADQKPPPADLPLPDLTPTPTLMPLSPPVPSPPQQTPSQPGTGTVQPKSDPVRPQVLPPAPSTKPLARPLPKSPKKPEEKLSGSSAD